MRNPPDHHNQPTAKRRRYDNAPTNNAHTQNMLPPTSANPVTPYYANEPSQYNNFHFPPPPPPFFRDSALPPPPFDPRVTHDAVTSSAHPSRAHRSPRAMQGQPTTSTSLGNHAVPEALNGARMPPTEPISMLLDERMPAANGSSRRAFAPPFPPPMSAPVPVPNTLPPLTLHAQSAHLPHAQPQQPFQQPNSPYPRPDGLHYPQLMHPPSHIYQSRRGDRPGMQAKAGRSTDRTAQTPSAVASGSDESLAVRQISQVKDALALLRDGSPIMNALFQTVAQKGELSLSVAARRERILNFRGFRFSGTAKINWLMPLSKTDLEILAWIFVVPKNGKKEDVARRIINSLRCPLTYRVPVVGKRPHIPARSEARPSVSNTTRSGGGASDPGPGTGPLPTGLASITRENAGMAAATRARASMPSLNPATDRINGRRESQMYNLTQQLRDPSSVVPDLVALRSTTVPPVSSASGLPRAPTMSKSKQMAMTCCQMLEGYKFLDGENAFNEPLNEPLGDVPYVFFSSAQLSRGTEDPILKFTTPGVLNAKDRPEVTGGDVQVHLRCLRVEIERPRTEWKQAWPFPASCRVNGHTVTLSQAQRYTNGKLAGRDAATNITAYLRKHYANGVKATNKITLRRQESTASAAWGQFVLIAQEILVHRQNTMMKNVKKASEKFWLEHRAALEAKGELCEKASAFDMARQGVMQFMNDPDGVTVSSMKVSLRCPLALTRIEIPVKGRRCQHVQCFDLSTFLEYARRSSKFDCPVCNKATAFPAVLVVSPYIEHALLEFKDCDEVEILKNGEMVPVERKTTGVASDDEGDGNANNGRENYNIDDIDDSGNGTGGGAGNGKVAEVVDLTLDSDDDDDNLAGITGGGGGINNNSSVQNGIAGMGSDAVDQEDIDFTFNADFCNWSTQPADDFRLGNGSNHNMPGDGGGGGGVVAGSVTNRNNNWSSDDVIAIDSD